MCYGYSLKVLQSSSIIPPYKSTSLMQMKCHYAVLITTTAKNIFFMVLFRENKKIRLDISCEWSAKQKIHMKCQVLFSLKNNKKKVKMYITILL